MKNKKAIEMGFNWLFAIIVGGFILFLAIYASGKFIRTSEKTLYTETAAKLVVLLDPMETGLASGKSSEINFNKETKTFYDCNSLINKPFGRQRISFSEKTFGEKYGEEGEKISIKDRYVFVENLIEGRRLSLFSKPFFMPFKIADLIIISSKDNNYCFYDTPEEIKKDIEDLNLDHIIFPNSTIKCSGTKVCFSKNSKCDIKIIGMCEDSSCENDYDYGYVQKGKEKLYYVNDLIYAAIFSSSEIYECNIKRLMSKLNELGGIYLNKVNIIERKGCYPTLQTKLIIMMNKAKELDSSDDLIFLIEQTKEIDQINEEGKTGCRLY